MSKISIGHEYKCDNDCKSGGCPGHVASLSFLPTADIYVFKDGQGEVLRMDKSQAEAMIKLFKQMHDIRADSIPV